MANIGGLPKSAWANNRSHPQSGGYPDNPKYGDRVFRTDYGMWMNYVYPDTTKPHIPNSYLWVPDAGQSVFTSRRTTNQTIPTLTLTAMTPNSIEYDPFGGWNAGTSKWIPPFPGAFQVMANVTWSAANSSRYLRLETYTSAGAIVGSCDRRFEYTGVSVQGGNTSMSVGYITNSDFLAGTAYFQAGLFHSHSASLTTYHVTPDGAAFNILYAGPTYRA